MTSTTKMFGVCSLFIAIIAVTSSGCGGTTGDQAGPSSPPAQPTGATSTQGDHSGWWCVEHGVPEEECSMCSAKAAADFKAKGDWCDEHHRAKSQCFICDPTQAEKYAALYEAKFGKEPPTPTE